MKRSVKDRQETGRQLLASAARTSFNPMTEIDWEAPIPDNRYGLPPEWCTLYGTRLWDCMTMDQRVALTIHEAASIFGTGIWLENSLMQMILRDVYDQDPSTPHAQFALTEIADECRHSIMFARAAERFGVPSYRPQGWRHQTVRMFKTFATGSLAYGGTLFAEEALDMVQREAMRDERVQPLNREVCRIHVVEEARHMRYAREEIVRRISGASWITIAGTRLLLAIGGYLIVTSQVNRKVYAAVGLDVREAVRTARKNTQYHEKIRDGFHGTVEFLHSAGLIGSVSKIFLRLAHII
ncbi:diiron oxygenase [Nocardia sp. BMG51109]|uniref:AurF N-oxygenase family protein n=1 Tax=Nocardia sp. BMG51109 TaxID=1056816 RepID=UPI00046653E4|nr:diiron oxygenase [Nocardia sp. BMG51109]